MRISIPALLLLLLATALCPAQVVINEIHYDPADNIKRVEFVELHNAGAQPVDLSGWRFEDGVDFLFPSGASIAPGGYFVVAQNAAAFQTQFGFAPHGVFTGELKNSGEKLQLRNASAVSADEVNYAAGFPWPTGARGGGGSMELIHPALDNNLGGAWRASVVSPVPTANNGTPRAQNSVFATNAPPAIRQVEHTPEQPTPDVLVTITAKVTDLEGVASVTLEYQLVAPGAYIRKTDATYATNWTSVPMHDDGADGDLVAGDGTFSVVLPASLQTHRRLVRYRITVADNAGATLRVPYADDEQPNFAYFVYNGVPAWTGALRPTAFAGALATPAQTFPSTLLQSIPPYHLLANAADVTNSQYNSASNDVEFAGAMIFEGVVYDHIQFKNRGIGSTYVSGKNKWAFLFNRARATSAPATTGAGVTRVGTPLASTPMPARGPQCIAAPRGSRKRFPIASTSSPACLRCARTTCICA